MTTPLSEERDLTNIDRLRIGALHVEPPFADEDLLDEITALETEVERLRALERDLYAALVAKQQEGDRLAGNYVAIRAENQSLRDHHYDLRTEVARLRARNAELVAVLREVEWGAGTYVYDDDGGRMIPTCPRCLAEKREGHAPDCALDAALRASNE